MTAHFDPKLSRLNKMPPQIAKLIPRLASEHDGEVVATARAIERLLRSADLDWHDVAKRVEPEAIATAYSYADVYSRPDPQQQPPEPPSKPRGPTWPIWSEMTRSYQLAWCDVLIRGDELDVKTLEFVYKVREKLHLGMDFHLAPRDKRKLTALIKAAIEAGNAARAAA